MNGKVTDQKTRLDVLFPHTMRLIQIGDSLKLNQHQRLIFVTYLELSYIGGIGETSLLC